MKYIYLFRLSGTNKFKIGISAQPRLRLAAVDREVKSGRVRVVACYRLFLASRLEMFLHSYFKHTNFIFKKAGSGKTEWFRLGYTRRIICMIIMFAVRAFEGFFIALAVACTIYTFLQITLL